MRKIERQPTVSTSQPPSGGPSAVVRAPAAPKCRSQDRARFPLYAAPTIARLAGVSSAAATPCAIRAAISQIAEGASAQASEAAVKPTQPGDEHAAPAESIPRRTAKQDETRERQHVAVDDPL